MRSARLFCPVLMVCLVLCSCGASKRITVEEAMPVQTVIDGMSAMDPTVWRSAFLPAYDAAVEAQELELGSCTDYNAYVAASMAEASAADELNYGKHVEIWASDVSVRYIDLSERPDLFSDFKDIFTLRYRLDVSSIEAAAEVSLTLNISGSKSTSSDNAVYITVKCGEKWYLHPIFYNLMY